ncbi:hypothetical protein HJFPF1_09509 [Paramyrothecium foliicola]|nr:hypothetical protein HJFPF1_09509 [Paramyrothecium foliicola]
MSDWESIITISAMMFSVHYVRFDHVRRVYDNIFARSYDSELEPTNGTELPRSRCGRNGIREMRSSTDELCTEGSGDESTSQRRGPPQSLALREPGSLSVTTQPEKRIVLAMASSNDISVPSLGLVLQGIANGDLSLHYASHGKTRPPTQHSIDIGTRVSIGQIVGSSFTSISQHHQTCPMQGQTGTPAQGYLPEPQLAKLSLGPPSISMYHARRWETVPGPNGGNQRVDGTASLATQRRNWRCPVPQGAPANTLWYIGQGRTILNRDALARAIILWGNQLYRDGYVGRPALRLILAPPPGQAETDPIDPANAGPLVHRIRGATQSSGTDQAGNPMSGYRRNFVMVNGRVHWLGDAGPPPPT